MTPKVMLATLCLNEMEWLPKLYEQHKDWPGLVNWTFVEWVDEVYAKANPTLVRPSQCPSVDGTSEWLWELVKQDQRITHIHGGQSKGGSLAQGKCHARNLYIEIANKVRPDILIIIDGDEFYTKEHQEAIGRIMHVSAFNAFIFHRREIWRPPSIADSPLFNLEVTGGFWAIPCCHWWRWLPNMGYNENHNTPIPTKLYRRTLVRYDSFPDKPQMVHLGFASQRTMREAKNRYYKERGEGVDDGRGWYVESRQAFSTWQPNDKLPHGAQVIPYTGPIPECFASKRVNE